MLARTNATDNVKNLCNQYFKSLEEKSVDYKILVCSAIHLQGDVQITKQAMRLLQVKPKQIIKFASVLEQF